MVKEIEKRLMHIVSIAYLEVVENSLQVESAVLRCICRHIAFPYSLRRCVEDC